MHQINSQSNAFFVLVETAIIVLSAYAGYVFLVEPKSLNPLHFTLPFYFGVSALVLSYLLGALSVGLYNEKLRESFRSIVRRIFVSVAMAYFMLGVLLYTLFPDMQVHENYAPLVLALILLLTVTFRYLVEDEDCLGVRRKRILILGAGERASIIERRMRRKVDQKGFELLGYVPMKGDRNEGVIPQTKQIVIPVQNVAAEVLARKVDCIVIACDERRETLPIDALFDCKIRGVEILDILDFLEKETGQIAVNLIYPSWVIYSNGFESNNYVRVTLDYAFNAMLATVVLLLVWPIMLVTALIIWLDDGLRTGASIFYTQERVGLDGRPFRIHKFRSMRPDAEKDGAKWATKNDDRTTRIGAFIRKYRIDELPQLINVFRGEMGFVGPRPERPEFVRDLIKHIPYYNQRHNVKPGLTGWAQLKYPYGSSMEDALEKLKYDLYYIKHRSVLLDLFILIRTVEIVLFGKGR